MKTTTARNRSNFDVKTIFKEQHFLFRS